MMPRFSGIPIEEETKPRFQGVPVEGVPELLKRPEPAPRKYSGLTALVLNQDPDMPLSEKLAETGKSFVRNAGVTARNILTGIEGLADFAGTPFRAMDMWAGNPDPAGGSSDIADFLGLPQPIGKGERIVGEMQKIVSSGAPMLATAQKLATGGSKLAEVMARAPEMQLGSMTGAGAAGGYTKESGYGPWGQLIAALAGGLTVPALMSAGKSVISTVKPMTMRQPELSAKITATVDQALKSRGIDSSQVSTAIKKQIYSDIEAAKKVGEVDPAQMQRMIDYRLTRTTPTAGPITQDPAVITQQKNLAAMGAASKDPKLQELARIQNENVKQLIDNLNTLGAGTADDQLAASTKVMNALDEIAKTQKNPQFKTGYIDKLYAVAKEAVGRQSRMDHVAMTNKAANLIDDANLNYKLPQDIKTKLNNFATGKEPLTVDTWDQFRSSLYKASSLSSDKAERYAIGLVRQAADETPLLPGFDTGKTAIEAFNAARSANRNWMTIVDKTPALKAAIDNIDPDKFMDKFITGSSRDASIRSVTALRNVIKNDPGAISLIKNYIARYLKKSATGGAEDELVKFSQSAYNRAVDRIGEAKLKLFFDKDELAMIKSIGKVASYEQSQPVGSAVNNSRSATTWAANALDWLGNIKLLRRIPLGAEVVSNPAKTVAQSMQAKQIMQKPIPALPKQRVVNPIPLFAVGAQGGNND